MKITLATINARYAHSSLALRCLKANLGPWRSSARLLEFTSGARLETMAETILADAPDVLGLSVYVWNVDELTRLAALLKVIAPKLVIVVGGPEVSFESEQQAIVRDADFLITGAGERAFRGLCQQLSAGRRPLMKTLPGDSLLVEDIELPYAEYTDEDIAHRYLYVEASRGCPFKCEFCLSSLDRTAVAFDRQRLLDSLSSLHARGGRTFKFIDRTFNLKIDDCRAILEFFLARIEAAPDERLLLHFELVPDHLPEALRELVLRFPPGVLQFEIGIQTWNPTVQALISRRQNNDKATENLRWLRSASPAHLHVDLIAGLPGEPIESFADGFDRLVALRPHEIQIGILKRLRGTPIVRHIEPFGLKFNPNPPYNLLESHVIGFAQMQRIQRFARFWDLIGNSGRFESTLPFLLGAAPPGESRAVFGASPYARFSELSEHLYRTTDSTHRFSAERLFTLVGEWLKASGAPPAALDALAVDRQRLAGQPAGGPKRDRPTEPAARGAADRARSTVLRHERRVVNER